MNNVLQLSGGKDSQAVMHYLISKGVYFQAVFCDTGWEHQITYDHIKYLNYILVENNLPELITVRSKKYDGMVDMAKKKKRFPSTKARFCTEELKIKPFIDWILSQKGNFRIYQGIRNDESVARQKMNYANDYFASYFIKNEKGKWRYSYRRKEVVSWLQENEAISYRPIIKWSAEDVFAFIEKQGAKVNLLYKYGMKRVGCFPCVMCNHSEVRGIYNSFPERLAELEAIEQELDSTFFPPGYIPKWACSNNSYPTLKEVVKYVIDDPRQTDIFNEEAGGCMSVFNVCE